VSAQLALAEAELLRAGGTPAAAGWHRAAAEWAALDSPLLCGYARLREGEARLTGRDGRRRAGPPLAEAYAIARRLNAVPLRQEVERLAARARVELADGPAGPPVPAAPGLTPRERQVLALLAEGSTNRQIARALFITEKTVSVHVSRVLAKLTVTNRSAAAAVAHRRGLLDPGP
jgi:DNA-binding CsgD family transcriptional regulator